MNIFSFKPFSSQECVHNEKFAVAPMSPECSVLCPAYQIQMVHMQICKYTKKKRKNSMAHS